MGKLDINHAAFTGFRITRNYPVMVLVLAILMFAFQIAFSVLLANNGAAEFNALQARPPATDMAQAQAEQVAVMAALRPFMLASIPLSLLLTMIVLPAIYRAVLTPNAGGLGFFKFGMDEIRQLAAQALIQLFLFLAISIYMIACIFSIGMIASFNQVIGSLLFLLALAAGMALLLMTVVHLSMAGPATFEERRVRVFSTWNLVTGKFWPVLGAYLLAFVFCVLVMLLGVTIQIGILAAVGGLELGQATPLPVTTAEAMAPQQLLISLFSGLFGALQIIILFAPAADIYRQLTGRGVEETF